jgi:hypothetical protein
MFFFLTLEAHQFVMTLRCYHKRIGLMVTPLFLSLKAVSKSSD